MLQAPADTLMQSQSQQHVNFSKFASKDAPTVQVPMKVINRPLPSELEESKVQRFMADIQKGDDFTPIEVLRCIAPDGQNYYFAFGGCHRYEAHKRLQSETIPGRIINVPPSAIRMYLGAGCPF
ncbi:sulfiredoxin [Rhodotorula paludigena]|uniref:sulfiredoxin n=1 Tax=Rhodotorula paludigena TaxID=86838 RepID=UPI00317B23D9